MSTARTLLYVAVFLAGFIAVSLWSFLLAVRPPKIHIGRTPADLGVLAEDVFFTASDGTPLAGWFIPEESVQNQKRAIIFLHGYPTEKSDMLDIAIPNRTNFGLLLMDLRSFGDSGGTHTTFGVKERDDIKKGLDFLHARGYERIGVFGFSLGGAVAFLAAQDDPRINAVAAYGMYADLRQLGYETYEKLLLLKYPLVRLMELWARAFFGQWLSDHAPVKAAQNLSIPVLLWHSRKDEQISFSHFERLRQALEKNPSAEFFIIEEGLHGELPPDFDARMKTFWEKNL